MFRLLKKLQMRGPYSDRGARNEAYFFVYAAVTSFDANKADGLFQQPDRGIFIRSMDSALPSSLFTVTSAP